MVVGDRRLQHRPVDGAADRPLAVRQLDRLELAVVLLADHADARRTRDALAQLVAVDPAAGAHRAPGEAPVLRDRLVRVGHVERGDALLEAAERHGVVARDRRADPHPAREPGDLLRAGLDAELRVDRVVGVGGRRPQGPGAAVGVLVVVDVEVLLALALLRPRHADVDLLRVPDGVGRDALGQRLTEHERLERRPRLALALRREVERLGAVVVAAHHREHLAGVVLHGDERRARAVLPRQPLVDGVLRCLLEPGVERRLHGQAALERAPCAGLAAAELVDDLLLDPRREVGVLRCPRSAAGCRGWSGATPRAPRTPAAS